MPDAGDLRRPAPCAARIAVLIMGHANPAIFGRLTGALDDPRIRLFAHIEKRSDQSLFEAEARESLKLWGEQMMRLLDPTPAKVVPMRRRARA